MAKAMLVMDYINEIVHPKGKLSGKGYVQFIEENNTIDALTKTIKEKREEGCEIIYVRVGFDEGYANQPKQSPLFGKAHEYGALQLNTWATEFLEEIVIQESDLVLTKHRVSPFFNTGLQEYLQEKNVDTVYLAGVATDLVVESAARDAHDRDYQVIVLANCCAAANKEDHEKAVSTMSKFCTIE